MHLTYRTELPGHDHADVFAWHERPGALQRLVPPWEHVRVERQDEGIRDDARVVLRVREGPTSFRVEFRHRDYDAGHMFRDEQVTGPLKSWTHTHRFAPLEGGGCAVEDDVELEPPVLGLPLTPGLLRRELDRLFAFRHRRLAADLARHAEHAHRPRLTVAVTGSSGLVGTALRHFLTTGGHRVIRLVRDSRRVGDDVYYWNPATGEIDPAALENVDAVVHLAGTSIAGGRWSEVRKRAIHDTRTKGTELLARTLAGITRGTRGGPRTLVSMSAVGFYGNRGAERLTEASSPGKGFLAQVARDWEAATGAAERAGLRVVCLRAGVAISPAGGALGQMLLPFKIGIGGRLGGGRQYFSWIDLDDLVALIVHAIYDDSLRGPVNAVAPNVVTNATFTDVLGRVLGRPTLIPVPAFAVKAAFGQLGEEALLWGQRAIPEKVLASGFRFDCEGVEDSLRFQLGRME